MTLKSEIMQQVFAVAVVFTVDFCFGGPLSKSIINLLH